MRTRSLSITALAAVLFTFSQVASQAAPPDPAGPRHSSVRWSFATRTDRSTNPHTDVFLLIGSRRVLVLRNVEAQFDAVARRDYHAHGVPRGAVAACTGWWAGQGEDLYVVRRRERWIIFMRLLDEEAPIPSYTQWKSVRQTAR